MDVSIWSLIAHDGVRLFVRFYRACCHRPGRSSCPTIVVLHGVNEHSGRYRHVAEWLVREGWNVILTDLRGHGRSDGVPSHADEFSAYLRDLDIVLDRFAPGPNQTVLCGHSFGGLVSVQYAQTRGERLALLVLLSPLLGINVPIGAFTLATGRLMSWIAPRVRYRNRVPPQLLTRCPTRRKQRQQDPYVHRSITAGWFFEMRRGLRTAWEQADRLHLPVLLCQAGCDHVVDPDAAAQFLEKTSSRDKTLRLYRDHYHELLNEPDWRSILADIVRWIRQRLPESGVVELRRCA